MKPKRMLLVACVAAICGLLAAGVLVVVKRQASQLSPAATAPAPAIDIAALTEKAEHGDTESQARLAKAYASAEGVRLDYKQAAHWYGLAASNGNAEAEGMLGELFQAGQGVPRDLTNALQWFTKAARQGNVSAQYDLAYLYEKGLGAKRDEKLAAHWYQLAAEGGDALSQYDYGQRCILGRGVSKDAVEGLKWLLIAAAQGQADSKVKAESLKNTLTSAQVSEAKSKAAAFTPRSPNR